MLDIRLIRENPDKVKKSTADKQLDPGLVDEVLELDGKRRELLQEIEKLRSKRNKLAKASGLEGQLPGGKNVEEGKKVKEELKKIEPELKKVEQEYIEALYQVPNLPSDDVPVGKDESENKVLRSWGEPIKFDFEPKDHLELGEALDIIDVKTAAKVSGSRFGYLKGDAVLFQFALIQFALSVLTDQKIISEIAKAVENPFDTPFIPVIPPVIAKADVMKKMDRFNPIDDRYYLEKDDSLLVGSAEHTLGPMHMDETFPEKKLPLRYVGYSTSFRREAGTYGKDTRGIFRVHQFDKLEMETFVAPEHGEVEQKFIVAIQEYLMQKLNIPYQVVIMCTGDMGKPDFRQIDINTWMPSENTYRETHTSDYMTDYQARRVNTKVQRKGATEYVHMNDATAFAMGRTIISILENYQQKDGSVVVPEVLKKWVGKDRIG